MEQEILEQQFMEVLVNGDRVGAQTIVEAVYNEDWSAEQLITDLFWPSINTLFRLHRSDQTSNLAHHFATRLLRLLIDQAQTRLVLEPRNGRRILISCGDTFADELSASMAADLIEAGGFNVNYLGGGVAFDEILAQIGNAQPDILMLFSSAAPDLPHVRELIDHVREINMCPDMQIAVGGGVYARAEGLADEIGADLLIPDLLSVTETLIKNAGKRATSDQRTVGRRRKGRAA